MSKRGVQSERGTGLQSNWVQGPLITGSWFSEVIIQEETDGLTKEGRDLCVILNSVTFEPYLSWGGGAYLSIRLSAVRANTHVVQMQPVSLAVTQSGCQGHKEVGGAVRHILPAAGAPATL